MMLYDAKNVLRRYDSVIDIMREFYDIRLHMYGARKVRINTAFGRPNFFVGFDK